MKISKKIKVLIIDDSLLFREMISRGISEDDCIEVVGTAADPYIARDKIIELEPDVLTLDVEMPKMNGIEFLKKLMPQYPIPVVVVSSISTNVFDALKSGAVDFVTKPDATNPMALKMFINELIINIKIASIAKVGHLKSNFTPETTQSKTTTNSILSADGRMLKSGSLDSNLIIAIGASTGGTEAIFDVIKAFPREMPGIVVVQHMPPVFTRIYAERLNNSCRLEVKEAQNGDLVKPGRVLIAAGDFHMKLIKEGSQYYVKCFSGEKVNRHCPSVDVLFDSVAATAPRNSIGIILTGMGNDGAKGLLNMRKSGAYTFGQDEKSSIVYGMPMVAFNIGAVSKQLPLSDIPAAVIDNINSRVK